MAEIRVSSAEVRTTAGTVDQKNGLMDEILKDIASKVNSLEGSWASDAGTAIREAMAAMGPRFEEYRTVINSYKDFLIKTADTYELTEEANLNLAESFK